MSVKIARFVSGAKVVSGSPEATNQSGIKKHPAPFQIVEDPDVVEESRQRDRYRIPHEFEDEP